MSDQAREAPGLPEIDVREWGGKKDGVRQVLDRRLFMQLLVFDVELHPQGLHYTEVAHLAAGNLRDAKVPHVTYEDANAPRGLGVLTWSTDPALFVTRVHPALRGLPLVQRDGWAMLGRTYAIGHEPELEHAILRRPVEYVSNEAWDWHVWYPLRRSGAFARLDAHKQATILREHASIGMAYGRTDLAHDVRLACHGLDARDNEFVIGLIGPELHPLSHIVQSMRATEQTSEYISQMGPFFVGRALQRGDGT